MKKINNIVKFTDKIFDIIIYIFLIIMLLFGGYALWQNMQIYNSGKISTDIYKYKPNPDIEPYSLVELQEINPDICGWITIDNTNIDYPIVKGKDNNEYLNHNYKNEYSIMGSIFMDYRNSFDFNDKYTLIYGHNMSGNLMFADVTAYKKEEYFNEHLSGYLYSSNMKYKLSVFAYDEVSAYSNEVYNISTYQGENNDSSQIADYFKKNATYYKDIGLEKDDKIIALSTCYSHGTPTRAVIVARIEKNDNESKKEETPSQVINTEITKDSQRSDKYKLSALIIIIVIIIIILFIIIIYRFIKRKNKNKTKK